MLTVLGIDPGTASTGYGVVAAGGQRLRALDGGVIATAAGEPLERRLGAIFARLDELLEPSTAPDAVAVEEIFFGRNVRTAFAVGQARGVVLGAAGMRDVPCFAYTPQAIKLAVCGTGQARQGPGPADGRGAARAARACRSPTTPPMRSRSRSAMRTGRWRVARSVRRDDRFQTRFFGRRPPAAAESRSR